MRFLLDENLSPRIAPPLIIAGHEALHVRDLGMAGSMDSQVLARAASDGLVLVTADRGDFGRELAFTGAVVPSVILLRQLPDVVRALDVAALLLANLTSVLAASIEAGAFVVLTPSAVRVRPLPLR